MDATDRLFPFAAIIGQDDLKEALILNAVNPLCGGVLARGEKGTAKSTAARSLSELLPPATKYQGCHFNCDPLKTKELCPYCKERSNQVEPLPSPAPFRTLPLNATEDRVAGSLNFEAALKTGLKTFEPGLLASVHRGILYVDEVNLLDDHIVDLILSAAANGENVVEREGISITHPARFILVGTMNPEEGELRPQLLDRFGLSVMVEGVKEPEDRVRLMEEREQFDQDSQVFRAKHAQKTIDLKNLILSAQTILPSVNISKRILKFIATMCAENNAAGHRADLILAEAVRAKAALKGLFEVNEEMVTELAPMVLAHRRREMAPPPPPPPPAEEEEEKKENAQNPENEKEKKEPQESQQEDDQNEDNQAQENEEEALKSNQNEPQSQDGQDSSPSLTPLEEDIENKELGPDKPNQASQEQIFEIGEPFKVKKIENQKDRLKRRGSGRRSRSLAGQKQGRYVKSGKFRDNLDLALDATIRAAAPYQLSREKKSNLAVTLKKADLRGCIREQRVGDLLFFLVDASGSMGARGRMAASKGAILSLLLDAYQKRDKVCLISFRRTEATVNLPLCSSVDLASKLLAQMPVGGRTPLSAGLAAAYREVRNALLKNPLARPIVIVITDGRANVPLYPEKKPNPIKEASQLARAMSLEKRIKFVVVDTEEPGLVNFNLASALSINLEAQYFKTNDLKASTLIDIIKQTNAN